MLSHCHHFWSIWYKIISHSNLSRNEQKLPQRRHSNGQEMHEKLLDLAQESNEMSSHSTSQRGAQRQKNEKQPCRSSSRNKGTLLHCWEEYHLVQTLRKHYRVLNNYGGGICISMFFAALFTVQEWRPHTAQVQMPGK